MSTGLKRNTSDKYYTNINIAKKCTELFKKYIKINKDDLIIEPSAGNGSFIPFIKKLSCKYIFYDIEPAAEDIISQDYLSLNFNGVYNNIHVIGNPPFGRKSSLAIRFIKKSAVFCHSISFILPKSFKKDSLKKCFPHHFHLIYEINLPINSFIIDGELYDVPCVFQIWQKKDFKRTVPIKCTPQKFKFVKKNEGAHIAIRRVGYTAGKNYTEFLDKSEHSHYFICFNAGYTTELIEKLNNIHYISKNFTVGPCSISKQEIIREFNRILS